MASAAKTRRFVASISAERTCACGVTFVRHATSRLNHCPACSQRVAEQAKKRAKEQRQERQRREAEAKAAREAELAARPEGLTCACGEVMATPAAMCGWCAELADLASAAA